MISDCYLLNHIFSFVPRDDYAIKETCKEWVSVYRRFEARNNPHRQETCSEDFEPQHRLSREYFDWARSHPSFKLRKWHLIKVDKSYRHILLSDGYYCYNECLIAMVKDQDLHSLRRLVGCLINITAETVLAAIETGDITMCCYVSRIGHFWLKSSSSDIHKCIAAAIRTGDLDIVNWTLRLFHSEYDYKKACLEAMLCDNTDIFSSILMDVTNNTDTLTCYRIFSDLHRILEAREDTIKQCVLKPLYTSAKRSWKKAKLY